MSATPSVTDKFVAAFMEGTPGEPALTEPAHQEAPAADAVVRDDGVKLPEATIKAMQSAGLDPKTASPQEVIDFLSVGNRKFWEERQRERKLRQTIEGEKAELERQLSGLSLEKILAGDAASNAKVAEVLATIQTKVGRLGDLETNLLAASENGLIGPEVLDAVRSATPESRDTIFNLLAQVQSKRTADTAARGAGVGTSVTEPPRDAPEQDDFFAPSRDADFQRTSSFVEALRGTGKARRTGF
ncbi:MAG: hypothetical protein WC381_10775 [Kiritimatiellia bacterium]|jgi:hypothetical protein